MPDSSLPSPVAYCIASDRYFKHDDVGIIYQMNVVPGKQRSFVGAMLLKAQFERSAYGCKLYCCWCAQDIAANKFWEAMGFVALAFRTGGEARRHVGTKGEKGQRADRRLLPSLFPPCLRAYVPDSSVSVPGTVEEKAVKKEPKPNVKNDPRLVAAARELRDRWLEQVNEGQYLPESCGKYEVSRELKGGAEIVQSPLLIEQAMAA